EPPKLFPGTRHESRSTANLCSIGQQHSRARRHDRLCGHKRCLHRAVLLSRRGERIIPVHLALKLHTNKNMKTLLFIYVSMLAWLPGAASADAAIELLVKWKDGPNSVAATVGNAQLGGAVKRNFNALGWQLVELPTGMAASYGIKVYQSLGTVTAV